LAAILHSLAQQTILITTGIYPKYHAITEVIKKTKSLLEVAISAHFNSRRINLMGEINSI